MVEYAELHCHSAFSLLDGASNPEELVARAVAVRLSALALTDHDDMGGMVRFSHTAKEYNLPAIVGTELTMEEDHHLVLLAQNLSGYKNICHLITKGRFNSERGAPRISFETLSEHADGVVALSGCPQGIVPALFARGEHERAAAEACRLRELFGENFFLELWDHNLHQEGLICRQMLDLSARWAIPWVVTNNVHYAPPEKRMIHDVLTCLKHETTLQTAGRRLRPNGTWYMKSPQEIEYQWQHDLTGVRNTLVVAERCQFRLETLKPVLPECRIPAGMDRNSYLRDLVWQGARERYGSRLTEKHVQQLEHELSIITRMQLEPYFLLMHEIVEYARSQGIAVQGRGSAANSAVCYCLMITAVDPIGMDLLFERFISEERNEPPDIDLDIAHQEREKVLQYVYQKYGRQYAAMVCEHITYRGPSSVRDAARVFGFSQEQADRLSAECQHGEARTAAEGLLAGGARRAGLDPSDRRVQLLIQVVAGLHQLPRHRSIHVGGFVLSGEPLGQIVPIEPAAMEDRTVIQWDKDDLELVGLIKIDLLGLGMLTLIQEGVKLVQQHRGVDLDLAQLDITDPEIYNMLQRADTIGLFQVESRAQMSILPRLKPICFYDIVVSIALVRPGPIQGKIIHPYLRRRRGLEPVTYLHPCVEPILKRTLGVPLFQEQGMRLAIAAAGFTAAEADGLRRVMTHKRSLEKMTKLCEQLAEGMRRNGLSDIAIETITFQLRAFANYGFPESHSASFALLVFASAHLKRYYAPEFFCAILNAQPMGFYSPATLIRDAIRHAVEVRPVDLAKSSWDCTLENDETGERPPALRLGMRYVNGLGYHAKLALQRTWTEGGSFTSVEDVCLRSGLKSKDLERLAMAGAFASFLPGRRRALWMVLSILRNRFDLPLMRKLKELQTAPEMVPEGIVPMDELEEIIADYRTTNLSTGRHPMTFYRQWADERGMYAANQLTWLRDGDRVSTAGGVIVRQRPETAKGFVFITLEDETGTSNIIINPQVFEQYRKEILRHQFLAFTGQLQLTDNVASIKAEKVMPLPRITDETSLHLHARNFH